MADVLLQDLWFHQVEGAVVESVSCGPGRLRNVSGVWNGVGPGAQPVRMPPGRQRGRRASGADRVTGPAVPLLTQNCVQATFAEQVDGLTFRHGRRSTGLQTVLERVAVMLAGRAGSRLAHALAAKVSRSTLLRLIRSLREPETSIPRVLGVDDFALRKGHNYGTILLDIETHQPVDLLPDRTTATVARWLAAHPGIEVICRDRSTAYAEAGRLGAPDAVHVADRWHIWSNLAEAVEKTVVQHRVLLREPQDPSIAAAAEALEGLDLDLAPAEPRTTGRLSDRVREQHEAVHALLEQGIAMREIGRRAGLARNTVRRCAHAASADELLVGRWTGRTSILVPYKPHLHQRWAEGCTVARRLFEEVRERGYPGGENVVKVYVAKLRVGFPPTPSRRAPSVRDVTSWLTRHPDRLADDQAQQLKVILARCPALDRTAHHVHAFAELMNDRQGNHLDQWINQVQGTTSPPCTASSPAWGRTSTPSSPASASATAPEPSRARTTRSRC